MIFRPRSQMLIVCQVELRTCGAVRVGKKTRRGHFTSAGISGVRSMLETERMLKKVLRECRPCRECVWGEQRTRKRVRDMTTQKLVRPYSSCGEMRRCHTLNSRSWWRQSDQDATTFSWVFLFGGFVNILVVPCFLANKFHVCFIFIVTTSELLVRQSIRTSNALPTLLKNSQRMTFLLALFHKTFCDARQSERFGSSLPPFCQINDFAGIADTPCRRPLFAPNFSEVTSLPAWVGSKVLATTTELLCFFGSPPLFSICLNAHSDPSLQPSFWSQKHSSGGPCSQAFPSGHSLPLEAKNAVATPLPFPLDSRLFSGSCFIPHLSPREHWPFVVHCAQSPLFLFYLPLDVPLAAATSEAGFSSSLSREVSRIFCSRCRTTIFSKTGAVSRFTFLNNILNVQRQQRVWLLWLLKLRTIHIFQNFLVGFLLYHDDVFIPSCIQWLHDVMLQFDLQNLIEIQNGFVCVADLECPSSPSECLTDQRTSFELTWGTMDIFCIRRRTVRKIEFFARARACWNVYGFWSCSFSDLLRVFAQFQMYWNLLCFWWCSFCVEVPMFLFVSLLFQSLFSLPSLPVLFMSVRIFTVSRALFLHALWMCVVEGRGTQGGVVWVRCDVFFWFYDYFQRFELFFAAIHARSRVEMRLYLHHGLCVISSRPPCLVILHVRSELAWRNGQGGSSKVEEEREKRWSGGRESGKTQPLRSKTPSSEKSKMQLLRSWTKIKKCFLSLEMRKTLLLRNKKRPLIIVWKDRFTC